MRKLNTVLMILFLSGLSWAQGSLGSSNGTSSTTGVVVGSQIGVVNNGANYFQLSYTTTGSPATISIQIEGSTNNGTSFALCGSAGATTAATQISCSGTFDKVQVNITALTGGTSPTVIWALQTLSKGVVTNSNTLGFTNVFNVYMVALPASATTATATTGAYRFFCSNTTVGAVTITITDNQGSPVTFVAAFSLGANSNARFPPGGDLLNMKGIKWNASAGASINCTVDGFQ